MQQLTNGASSLVANLAHKNLDLHQKSQASIILQSKGLISVTTHKPCKVLLVCVLDRSNACKLNSPSHDPAKSMTADAALQETLSPHS